MDELIFQFLLQAGYPRASIVADATLLTPGGAGEVPEEASTYVVVDPESAERLAAIEVVEAIDGPALRRLAADVGRYAERIGGREMQGFVIRVDPRAPSDAEQVQFFRVWPNPQVQQLSAKTFPDLDALKVAHRLSSSQARRDESEIVDILGEPADESARSTGVPQPTRVPARHYVLAATLVLLAVIDGYLQETRGAGFLNLTQAVLAVGAAGVIALAA